MIFKLVYGNHWNFGIVVADTLLMLKYALEEMGFKADIEKEPQRGCINIIIENFDAAYVEKIAKLKDDDTFFWMIVTEDLTGQAFNLAARNGSDATQYSKSDYWDQRYDSFKQVLPYFDVLWHPIASQVPLYQVVFSGKVLFLPHGYTDDFATVKHRPAHEKDIDFIFTGSMTEYRKNYVDKLLNKGYSVMCLPVLTASFHRDDAVARAKIGLNIKQSDSWTLFSNSRANYHICNNSLLISEFCPDYCDVANYVIMPENAFLERAEYVLNEGLWQNHASDYLDGYKANQRLSKLIKADIVNLVDSML